MSIKIDGFNIETKLKSNERLLCSGCYFISETVVAAAEHTIQCRLKGMEGKQKRRKLGSHSQIKFQKIDTPLTSGRVIVSLHWSRRNVARLLKCIYHHIHLFTPNDWNESGWKDVEVEMKKEFPWMLSSVCRTKWQKLKDEVESFLSLKNETAQSLTTKPDFFYVVRELSRRMTEVEGAADTKLEENEDDLLADPDAVEEEPFAGVMDSQGNMHMREVLVDVIHGMEVEPGSSNAALGERHGVEEAVVEWVRENRDSILKGSLRCPSCERRLLRRQSYLEHVIDCITDASKPSNGVDDKGGYVFSYDKDKCDGSWSSARTSSLITLFNKRASSFLSPQGLLRKGIWLEVYNGLKPKFPEVTPRMCSDKWTSLVKEVRDYHRKGSVKTKTMDRGGLTFRPAFYDEVASIVDLEAVDDESPQSFLPKKLILQTKGRHSSPFEEGERSGSREHDDTFPEQSHDDAAVATSNDSFEETLSVGESSGGEGDEDEGKETRTDSWRLKARLSELESQLHSMGERVKELEDNHPLHQGGSRDKSDEMSHLTTRMEQFIHTQSRIQTQQTEMLTKMMAMWERHHRENLTAMKALIQEVSRKRPDTKEKKGK